MEIPVEIKKKITTSEDLQSRLAILKVASEINKDFKNPYIIGGFLRDTILGEVPNDCDVIFEGIQKDQPGILESVQEAEGKLGVPHFTNWEFENSLATGLTGNVVEDNIGFYSHHTDYLTLVMININGEALIGEEQTVHDLLERRYDVRYPGLMVWTALRGYSYFSVLVGVGIRAFYQSIKLHLYLSPKSQELLQRFDECFNRLSENEKERTLAYWIKKSEGIKNVQDMLAKYQISVLKYNVYDARNEIK